MCMACCLSFGHLLSGMVFSNSQVECVRGGHVQAPCSRNQVRALTYCSGATTAFSMFCTQHLHVHGELGCEVG